MAKRKPLEGLELGIKKRTPILLIHLSKILYDRIIQNISLTDHSTAQLKAEGFPYSKRNPQELHDPPYLVHKQTGRLASAVTINQINQYRAQVGIDEAKAPYVADVIYGTGKLIGRDFLAGSLNEVRPLLREEVQEGMQAIVQESSNNVNGSEN